MQINIRRATVADAEVLSVISKETFFATFTGTCTEEDMQWFLEKYFNVAQVQQELENTNDFYYLAETEEGLAGYLRFMEDYESLPLMKQWKALELKRIYIKKEFQGIGVAQQLMDFFLAFAKENKYEAVWLGVWEHNARAQKFYGKYGFVHSGHTHDFPIHTTPQTDSWMWKFL